MNIRQSANMSKVEDAVHDLEAIFNHLTSIEVEITEGSNKIDEDVLISELNFLNNRGKDIIVSLKDGLRNIRKLERSE